MFLDCFVPIPCRISGEHLAESIHSIIICTTVYYLLGENSTDRQIVIITQVLSYTV